MNCDRIPQFARFSILVCWLLSRACTPELTGQSADQDQYHLTLGVEPEVDEEEGIRLDSRQLRLGPSPASAFTPSPLEYTASGDFPVKLFDKYYNDASDPTVQPQPIITDPITHVVYPLNLTSPDSVPTTNLRDPISLPPISLRGEQAKKLAKTISQEVIHTINITTQSNCQKCRHSLQLVSELARKAPQHLPDLVISLCNTYRFRKHCQKQYGLHADGPIIAQMLAFANTTGEDGQYICSNFLKISGCPLPPPISLDLSKYINSTRARSTNPTLGKPSKQPIKSCKPRLKVLHISDFHLDPRYATGSEANCSKTDMCCRAPSRLPERLEADIKLPAPRFGYYQCDTPLSLAMAVVESIPVLTGTDVQDGNGFDFTVYTGDLVAHDKTYELSRDYVEYIETLLFDTWKKHLGGGPLYAAIGNHDSYLQAQDAPHSLMPERLAKQFSWNYNHLSRLWLRNHWIPEEVARISRAHYGGYAVKRYQDLKIVVLNTDMWYRANMFNYINTTDPDASGMLKFLAEELHSSEEKGESVWIMGHVLSGWDGSNPMSNPSNLFYQMVDRYSPHVIKTIIWGHTHEDQFSIFYRNNASDISAEKAVATAWIGPSITPLTNVNSGFRMYEVDPDTYEIMDAHTWYSDVSKSFSLDHIGGNINQNKGPTYKYEYSTREVYGKNIDWSRDSPLNATWWHLVTEQMLKDNGTLMEKFTHYQGKSSIRSPNCTNQECIESKVCYMRSGSAPIGNRCKRGYGSVQGPG